MKKIFATCLLGASVMPSVIAQADAKRDAAFTALADSYFDTAYFPYQPTTGTLSGYHQYDAQIEDRPPKTIAAQIAPLHDYEKRVASIDPAGLSVTTRGDRELVLSSIRSSL